MPPKYLSLNEKTFSIVDNVLHYSIYLLPIHIKFKKYVFSDFTALVTGKPHPKIVSPLADNLKMIHHVAQHIKNGLNHTPKVKEEMAGH